MKYDSVHVQLLEAGLRELKEETGLKLKPEDVSPKILGLWEVRVWPAGGAVGPRGCG